MHKHHNTSRKNAEHKFHVHMHQLISTHPLHSDIYNEAKLIHHQLTVEAHGMQNNAWMGEVRYCCC